MPFVLVHPCLSLPSCSLEREGTVGKFARGLSAFAGEGGGRLFVQLATLAGCDYVDNVKGLGLLTALPVIVKFKCIPADSRVKQILMLLQRKGKLVRKQTNRCPEIG